MEIQGALVGIGVKMSLDGIVVMIAALCTLAVGSLVVAGVVWLVHL